MTPSHRRLFSGVSLTIALMAVTACSGQSAAPKKTETTPVAQKEPANRKKVTIYTSVNQTAVDEMKKAADKALPDLDVNFVTAGGTEQLAAKLDLEYKAGVMEADAVMLADPSYTLTLQAQGRLIAYKPKGIDQVKVDKDPDGFWFGVRVLNTIIVYNTDLVQPNAAPKSYKELLDPKWKGQVAMPDPTKSGSTFATVGALVFKYGWDYFDQATKNEWQVGGGSSEAPKKIGDGKAKVGLVLEENYVAMKKAGKKVAAVWPQEGSIMIEGPFAIVKGGPNPEGTKTVADWMLTKEPQSILANVGQHSVVPGVQPGQDVSSLEELLQKGMKVDWKRLTQEKAEISRKIPEAIVIKG